MEKETLLKFIALAHKNTYAAPKEVQQKHKCENPILPGHKDYEFSEGDFIYHDSYAGSTWAPGKEVVFFKNKPIWSMAYQGKTISIFEESFFQEKIFPFLKKALMNFDKDTPFRGPKEFKDDNFKYIFDLEGNYEYFKGQEKVFYNNEVVFIQDVMGGLIK